MPCPSPDPWKEKGETKKLTSESGTLRREVLLSSAEHQGERMFCGGPETSPDEMSQAKRTHGIRAHSFSWL